MALNINYEEEVLKILRTLDDKEKQQVLDYVRVLKKPRGEPSERLIDASRKLNFDEISLHEMEKAIEDAFEVVEDFKDINLDE